MKSGIYCITNKINGKLYIGSSVNIGRRFRTHRCYLRKGIHPNAHLQSSWNKYKEYNFDFSIIFECEESKVLYYEQFYISSLKPEYNKAPVAGNMLGYKHSEESRKKMSKALKGRFLGKNSPCYGKKASKATREKQSLAKIGKYKGKDSHQSKPVICLNNGMTFECMAQAISWLKSIGYEKAAIINVSRACKGVLKSAYKHQWKFV